MKTKLLAALAIAVVLAGCSKDRDDDDDKPNVRPPAPVYQFTLESIQRDRIAVNKLECKGEADCLTFQAAALKELDRMEAELGKQP